MFTVSRLAVGASTSGFGLLGVWAAEVLLTWDLSWPKWVWTNLAHWRVGWSVWDTKMEAISIGYGGPRIWSSRSKSANVKKGCRFRLQWCWNISLLHRFVPILWIHLDLNCRASVAEILNFRIADGKNMSTILNWLLLTFITSDQLSEVFKPIQSSIHIKFI